MQSVELATMIAIVARPRTTPPAGVQISERGPEPSCQPRRVSFARRTIGFWPIGLGGVVAGR